MAGHRHELDAGKCVPDTDADAGTGTGTSVYPICFPPDNALKCSKLGASSKCKGTYCCRPKPAADQHCAACGQDGRCSECDAG